MKKMKYGYGGTAKPKKKKMQKMKKGGFPDLTGDGKVTRADVLKGRGVFKHGGMVHKKKKRKNSFEQYD